MGCLRKPVWLCSQAARTVWSTRRKLIWGGQQAEPVSVFVPLRPKAAPHRTRRGTPGAIARAASGRLIEARPQLHKYQYPSAKTNARRWAGRVWLLTKLQRISDQGMTLQLIGRRMRSTEFRRCNSCDHLPFTRLEVAEVVDHLLGLPAARQFPKLPHRILPGDLGYELS